MSILRMYQVGGILSLVFVLFHLAEAKDLTTLQATVAYAREEMEKAKTEHEANVQAATQQQRIVEERKKQLADETKRLDQAQKDTNQAWKQYLEAKQKYEKAQSTLKEAWGK